jgi:hypothetical protein
VAATETRTETTSTRRPALVLAGQALSLVGGGGGYEIRTREGVNPTRFPRLQVGVRQRLATSGYAWLVCFGTVVNGAERWQLRPELRPLPRRPVHCLERLL